MRHKLCLVLVYSCLHGTVQRYLQDVIQPVDEVTSRRRLRSASSSALVVPATRRSSVGDRAFAVAGPRAWNSLPEFVTDCLSPLTFKKYLNTHLFSLCFRARIDCVKCPCSLSQERATLRTSILNYVRVFIACTGIKK